MWVIAATLLLAACGGDTTPVLVDAGPCMDPHDEDGDGIGDRCDICPAAPDPLQRDTTEVATMLHFADGVGDACDPRPALGGDKLGAFHAFADATTAAAWNGSGWAIENDVAHSAVPARWIHRTREQGDGVFVQARVARGAWQAGSSFEVIVDGNGVETGYTCALYKDRDGDGNDELEGREANGVPAVTRLPMSLDGATAIIVTAWRIIDVNRVGEVRCSAKLDAVTTTLTIATSDDLAVGLYGFAQANSTTEVASVVVYTSPTLPVRDP